MSQKISQNMYKRDLVFSEKLSVVY